MKTNANFRFGMYVLWMTTFVVGIALSFYHDFPAILLCLLLPSITDVLGPDFKAWSERERDISNRALIVGVIVSIVALWVGGITLARYISPARKPPEYLLWAAGAVLWLLLLQPGYRWWRAQRRKAAV